MSLLSRDLHYKEACYCFIYRAVYCSSSTSLLLERAAAGSSLVLVCAHPLVLSLALIHTQLPPSNHNRVFGFVESINRYLVVTVAVVGRIVFVFVLLVLQS